VRDRGEGLPHKRERARSLGEEIARLHRSGFVHGHLTPYIVIVEGGEPPRFVFIDNERTRRATIGRMRSRLRNLVQLGRFEPPGADARGPCTGLAGIRGRAGCARPARVDASCGLDAGAAPERRPGGKKSSDLKRTWCQRRCRHSPSSSPVASERRGRVCLSPRANRPAFGAIQSQSVRRRGVDRLIGFLGRRNE
jgi:hypothetical protein